MSIDVIAFLSLSGMLIVGFLVGDAHGRHAEWIRREKEIVKQARAALERKEDR